MLLRLRQGHGYCNDDDDVPFFPRLNAIHSIDVGNETLKRESRLTILIRFDLFRSIATRFFSQRAVEITTVDLKTIELYSPLRVASRNGACLELWQLVNETRGKRDFCLCTMISRELVSG